MAGPSLHRSLQFRYATALVLVALLSVASFSSLMVVMSSQEADAPTINVSGRQRMLSQRVSLMALRYATAPNEAERDVVGKLLDDAIDLMERSHRGLVEGDDGLGLRGEKTPQVAALYYAPTELDSRVVGYLADARELRALPPEQLSADLPLLQGMLARSQKPLLRDLNAAVKAYEVEGSGRVTFLQQAQLGLLILTVVLLLAEGALIFEPMVQRIVSMVDQLHEQHSIVEAREAALQLVLDSTADGFLPITEEGRVREHGVSSVIATWFGEPTAGTPFWELLFPDDPRALVQAELCFEQLKDGFLPEELLLAQMPSAFERNGQHFRVGYRRIADETSSWLLTIRDVTAEVVAAREREASEELQTILLKTMRERESYDAFVDETERLLQSAEEAETLPQLLRQLHTLKGNTALFGFMSLSRMIHHAEDQLLDEPDTAIAPIVVALRDRWQHDLERISEFVGARQLGVWLDDSEISAHLALVMANTPASELEAQVRRWRFEPAQRRMKNLAASAERIAARLNKEVSVEVSAGFLRLPPKRFGPFWTALVHVVRNAVDHGLETPSDREAAGKPRQGVLQFCAGIEDEELVVDVRDDGKGIDWVQLRKKAADRGVDVDESTGPVALIFANGVSSRDEVTELSGRGVGLAAVKEAVDDLNGRIEVKTEPGQGSLFRFRFPLAGIPELAALDVAA